MADKADKADKADETEKADKKTADKKASKKAGKKGGKKKGTGAGSIATHPRAAASVRRAKGFGGLAGFGIAALLSHGAGLAASQVVERALVAGVGGYLLAWACAVAVWRSLVTAEVRAVIERRQEMLAARPAVQLVGAGQDTPAPAPAEPAPAAEQR